MKFQNISIHGSKVMLCTRKREKERTSQKQYVSYFFKVWSIMSCNVRKYILVKNN